MGDSGGGVTKKKQKKIGIVPGAGDSAEMMWVIVAVV